jgi:hypothetical protein
LGNEILIDTVPKTGLVIRNAMLVIQNKKGAALAAVLLLVAIINTSLLRSFLQALSDVRLHSFFQLYRIHMTILQ